MEVELMSKRLARFSACIVFIAGLGVVFLVGALRSIPMKQLWTPLFWGGVASLTLGWAVGHAAGRLFCEVNTRTEIEEENSDVVEENCAERVVED